MIAVWIQRSTLVVVHDALETTYRHLIPRVLPWEVKVNQLAEQYYAVWVPSLQEAGLLEARAVWFNRHIMADTLMQDGAQVYSPMIIAPSVEEASMYYHMGVRVPAHLQYVAGMTPEIRFAFEPFP